MYTVTFEAIPFCFGPASEAASIAAELEHWMGEDALRLYGIGDGTTYDIFDSDDTFEECLEFDYSAPDPRPAVNDVLSESDLVLSSNSPTFVATVAPYEVDCFVVDNLHWMDDTVGDDIAANGLADRYYMPAFPGIETVVGKQSIRSAPGTEPVMTDAIRNNRKLAAARSGNEREEGFILVNFGGIDTPLGANEELAVAMAEEIAAVTKGSDRCEYVLLNGGGSAIRKIADVLDGEATEIDVVTETRPPEQFLRDLAESEAILTVPGINIMYESLYFRKKTMVLLPVTYGHQLLKYNFEEILTGFVDISYDDFNGYETVPPNLLEEEGVNRIFAQGEAFGADPQARRIFRDAVKEFVHDEAHGAVRMRTDSDGEPLLEFDGAAQIASDMVDYLES